MPLALLPCGTRRRDRPIDIPSERPVKRLDGKVVLISGGGPVSDPPGTGMATAIVAAREGADVVVVNRHLDHADELAREIREHSGSCLPIAADVTDRAQIAAAVVRAVKEFGRVDVLVNNVGLLGRSTVDQITEQELDEVLSVNLKSAVLLIQAVIPSMVEAGAGSIVNISSVGAYRPSRGGSVAYHAAKAGVLGLTRSVAATHGSVGIRVNSVSVGPIFGRMHGRTLSADQRALRVEASPLRREGTAWDVARAVVFLASDDASWITGINLPVDGGIGLTLPTWKTAVM
jgi:NAD(P)-dependent dehydrogenase (short-subunit alcohol dehydrogenase family)